MKFSIKAQAASQARADVIVAFVYANKKLSRAATALNKAASNAISRAINSGDISGKSGSSLLLRDVPGIKAARVLLIGAGDIDQYQAKTFTSALHDAAKALFNTGANSVAFAAFDLPAERDAAWAAQQAVLALRAAAYRFDQLKSEKKPAAIEIKSVELLQDDADQSLNAAVIVGVAIANGVDLTKDLGNLPSNYCTPSYLADSAKKLGKEFKFNVEVLERKQLQALKMGSFLSVTHGSAEPPKFIVMKYEGGPSKQAPVVLVGKGITFDSGGISLKPGEAMDEMKYDMSGAGTVLGVFRAIAEAKLPINVIGLVPTCENMPSGTATKPGDVVTSMSGQTIEVLNTDAEGRLILCDALTYAERFKPAAVIDIATLTGACVIALGHVNTGLFSTQDALADELLQAGARTLDTAWRLPLDDAYQEQLKSNFADLANIGGRPAGAITAACFLSRFTKQYDWAHLDIAGTAWKSGKEKGATGRPVPLLVEFLQRRVAGKTAR